MKTLSLLTFIALFIFTTSAYAQMQAMEHAEMDHSGHERVAESESTSSNALPVKSGDAKVAVNGLVCDFCARALEKTFGKKDEVKAIDVDLDSKIVTIMFKDGQSLDDATLRQIITDSGYNVKGITHVE